MTLFLLRDDDANATTNPDRLERVYAPLLDTSIPVSFAVIPEVALDTRASDGMRERFLDEATDDCDRDLTLSPEHALARWLRRHEGSVDAFVHGLSHRRLRAGTEFGALTYDEATVLIQRGFDIMTRALGRAPIGFVPPWDSLSAGSLRAATRAFDVVSTGWIDRPRLPLVAWPAHILERLSQREALRVGRSWLLRHRGGLVRNDTRPREIPTILRHLAKGADIAVIVLHHWMFWDRPDPHPAIVALAGELKKHHTGNVRDVVRHLDGLPRLRLPDLPTARNRIIHRAFGR